ncbi:hypothetical protein EVAR_72635_1 [Eumeta japonica]|uniref:Uncharacterized protein n=1 Tax=Eumeta variegata TaxID=151549 RepID=A0A4C1TP99_EUMVA|nr:hypothetical protein EVAR_72635_1 [Eumeta japonica]
MMDSVSMIRLLCYSTSFICCGGVAMHFGRMSVVVVAGLLHPTAGAGAGMRVWIEPGHLLRRETAVLGHSLWRLSSTVRCPSAHTFSSLGDLDSRSRGS